MPEFDFDSVQEYLRCPKTRAEFVYHEGGLINVDPESRLRYPVEEGIPRLLEANAAQLAVEDWQSAMEAQGRDPATGSASQ